MSKKIWLYGLLVLLAAVVLRGISAGPIVVVDPFLSKIDNPPLLVSKFTDRGAGVVCYLYGNAMSNTHAISCVKIDAR